MSSTERLAGRFVLQRALGRGAFGEVWLAHDERTGSDVALKVLRAVDGPAVARFKRELRAVAELQHGNLVRLYELLRDGDRWLLSMEHVPGVDLAELEPDLDDWASLLPQALDALGALHAAGVVHRDLKASNLRVTPEGRLVVLDFGLVAAFHDARETGLSGSPHTMAPEQAGGRPPSSASDWYALGVLLHQAATGGRTPFQGAGSFVVAQKRERDPAPVRALAPRTPDAWAALIDRLLRRAPEERMEGLAEALTAASGRAAELTVDRGPAPFVARADERAALGRAIDAVSAGTPRALLLTGPSGIGKTALLDWLSGHAAESGLRVLRGRCFASESVPHAGLDMIVDELARELGPGRQLAVDGPASAALRRIFPVLAPSLPDAEASFDGPSLRRHAARGLRALVREVVGERSTAVLLDDVQWADRDSAWLLARTFADLPALFVCGTREEDAAQFVDALEDELTHAGVSLARVPLGPFDVEDVEALVGAIGGDAGGVAAAALHRKSSGHPFFLVELVRSGAPRAASLDDVLVRRLAECDPRERELLAAIATSGRPLSASLAADVLARLDGPCAVDPPGALLHAGTGLERRRWIRRGADGLELMHDRLRVAATGALDEAARRRMHGAFDDGLAAAGTDDPERRARHALEAGRIDAARDLTMVAARRAHEALAFHRAADLYRRVVALDAPATLAREAGEGRARALADGGRNAEAAEALEALLRQLPAGERDPAHARIARECAEQWFHAGRAQEGYEALRIALASAGVPPPRSPRVTLASVIARTMTLRARGLRPRRDRVPTDRERARIDACHSAAIALTNVDSLRGMDYVLRSAWMALDAGDEPRSARAIGMLANYATSGGSRTAARAATLIEHTARWARELDDPPLRGLASGARTLLAFHNGRYREAFAHAGETFAAYERLPGHARERVTAHIYQIASLLMAGELERAAPFWEALLEDGDARRDRFASTNARSGLMNALWLARGEVGRARREAERAIAVWGEPSFHVQHFFDFVAQTRIDLYEGRIDAAVDRVRASEVPLSRSLLPRMQFVRIVFADLDARAHLARGTPDALARARRRARTIRREGVSWGAPHAIAIEAELARRAGRVDRAIGLATAAREGFAAQGMRANACAMSLYRRRWSGDRRAFEWPGVADPERFARIFGPPLPGSITG